MKNNCVRCGKEFIVLKRGQKYCGTQCFHANQIGVERLNIRKREIRVCINCGSHFETGGKAGRNKLFCSRKCQAVLRVHSAKVNIMSSIDASYFAGLMDGEGSIIIAINRGGRNTWRITISNTDFDLLKWCMDTAGCGTLIRHVNQNIKHADSGAWQCYSWNAMAILKQIFPYMKLAKKINRANQMITELDMITLTSGG